MKKTTPAITSTRNTAKRSRAFSQLRTRMAEGDPTATATLRQHVQRRVAGGWAPKTIAKRLGLTVPDVALLARTTRTLDTTPRLRRSR
jgi:hypothetical protein